MLVYCTVFDNKPPIAVSVWQTSYRHSKHPTHLHPLHLGAKWRLVLGRVTTKEENHPCLRIAYTSYIWRVIKFYQVLYLLTNSVMVSLPDSQSGGTEFNIRQALHMLGAHQTCHTFGTSKMVPASTMVNGFNSIMGRRQVR